MKNSLEFRLVHDRQRKTRLAPEFRSIVDIEEVVTLSGSFQIVGTKERNGNIQVTIEPFYESDIERKERLKKPRPRPLSKRTRKK